MTSYPTPEQLATAIEGALGDDETVRWWCAAIRSYVQPKVRRRNQPRRTRQKSPLPGGKELEDLVYEILDIDWDSPNEIQTIILHRCFPDSAVDLEGWDFERKRIEQAFMRLVKKGKAEKGGWNDVEWRKL